MSASLIGEVHTGGAGYKLGVWEGTTTYKVFCTDKVNDRESEVLSVVPVSMGDPHPDAIVAALGVWCRGVTPRRTNERELGLWVCTAEWSNAPISKSEQERTSQPNPLLRKARISGGIIREAVAYEADADDEPMWNGAHDPFNPPFTKDGFRDQINVSVNLAAVPIWYSGLRGKINTSTVYIGQHVDLTCAAYTLLFSPAGFSEGAEDNGYDYTTVSFTLDYDPDGWDDLEIANKGLRCLTLPSSYTTKVKILGSDGRAVTDPQWLEANGLEGTTPNYIVRNPYPDGDFSVLTSILA